jgi:hypothetical protein
MGVLDLRPGAADVHDLEADGLVVARPIALPFTEQSALVIHPLVDGRNLAGALRDDGHGLLRRMDRTNPLAFEHRQGASETFRNNLD